MSELKQLLQGLMSEAACLVTVQSIQGSVPREVGAWMAVFAAHTVGTVGGGHLEHQAIAEARRRLSGRPGPARLRWALGPRLGQCCGGVAWLGFEPVTQGDAPRLAARWAPRGHPVALFGGGHVGQALVRALAPLPFAVTWIDSREGVFAERASQAAACEHSDPVHQAVPALVPDSRVLVMSFSHAEDFEVVVACLRRQRHRRDLPFIGLIGSQTKWAAFSSRLRAQGFTPQELQQVTCPIGVAGIQGKQPAVIAAAVAAQLLQTLPVPPEVRQGKPR
ncbi:MAG: xanthine dehydrogenase accessory protein XdhC [Burkholderiaceae bacterium]|nr:xanthine dehydrogenase accessory protein XdhC [Burkholderiaceae bacterium]